YKSVRTKFGIKRNLNKNLALSAAIDRIENNYPEKTVEESILKKRQDIISAMTLGLEYNLQDQISFGFELLYRDRNSNHNIFDYTNNRMSIYLSVDFL
ncbi:MAG: outer membrane beta-barrel protein, partial [Atribacterota bacterium]